MTDAVEPSRAPSHTTLAELARRPRLWKLALFAFLVSLPYLPFVPFSIIGNINHAAHYALVGISIVVLTGWVGQISLGHAGFVGLGAYATGMAVGGLHIGFPVALLWGAAAGMLGAVALGVVALRVRGLYLAVATLLFAWMAEQFLFRNSFFQTYSTIKPQATGVANTFPYFDWSDPKVYFFMAWAMVILSIFLMSNLRDSKTGRAFFAVRGSEVAAASLAIDVVKTKLVAFAVSGVIAGAAGALYMAELATVSPDAFKVDRSLFFLAIAVVGGLSSLGGSVAAGILFAMLDEAFLRFTWLAGWLEVVPAVLLAGTLLLYRGGLAEVPLTFKKPLRGLAKVMGPLNAMLDRAWLAVTGRATGSDPKAPKPQRGSLLRRRGSNAKTETEPSIEPLDLFSVGLTPANGSANGNGSGQHDPVEPLALSAMPVDTTTVDEAPAGTDPVERSVGLGDARRDWRAMTLDTAPLPENRNDRRPLIEANQVTVKFGGLTAVNEATLKVCEGEIVGLIGPNGAGKTTCFNSIAGLNVPTSGEVRLFGREVTNWPVHKRAALGVGRTFQAIQLFGQLSVFDNLLVATDRHNDTGLFAHLAVTGRSVDAEKEARKKVQRALELLDLTAVADRRAKDLPFGVLRMVEVARALVTGARLIMLDEPASGLDNKETDRLADILLFVRSLGVTLLLIEHDVRMVTGVSDYMYVLDRGNILAEGTPDQVQRDQRVIAAYLGQAEPQEVRA